MNQDDAKDEADVAVMRAQVMAAMKGDSRMTMKVYALLEAASMLCDDEQFLVEAFQEIVFKRSL